MSKIKVGIIGVGNCASSLVQGTYYYVHSKDYGLGIITQVFGNYTVEDIQFTCAFDIDRRKIGKDLSCAIFEKPNCSRIFYQNVPVLDCTVNTGYQLDGFSEHLLRFAVDKRIDPTDEVYGSREEAFEAIVSILKKTRTEILINYLPVGSENAARFYAECCLEAKVALINAMPVFLSKIYGDKFAQAGIPILGDDIKSQVGATIVHRMLSRLIEDRGGKITKTYQLNIGGNTDFLNMKEIGRLESKKISKTQSVKSQIQHHLSDDDIHVGPSDYVPWLEDKKTCFIRIEAEQYGSLPLEIELKLTVEDSPNSAGIVTDAIRAAKVALDRGLKGPIIEASAYLFKSPVTQYEDSEARDMLKRFADNKK